MIIKTARHTSVPQPDNFPHYQTEIHSRSSVDLLQEFNAYNSTHTELLQYRWSPDTAVELQTGETPVEISVDDLRLRIWKIIRPWNWGVTSLGILKHVQTTLIQFINSHFFTIGKSKLRLITARPIMVYLLIM